MWPYPHRPINPNETLEIGQARRWQVLRNVSVFWQKAGNQLKLSNTGAKDRQFGTIYFYDGLFLDTDHASYFDADRFVHYAKIKIHMSVAYYFERGPFVQAWQDATDLGEDCPIHKIVYLNDEGRWYHLDEDEKIGELRFITENERRGRETIIGIILPLLRLNEWGEWEPFREIRIGGIGLP